MTVGLGPVRPGATGRLQVCVVGSGGREHALATALARTADVVVTPGNAGMARLSAPALRCLPLAPEDVDADLFVIGPEDRLVDGLADRLRAAGKRVLGPGADGARLEGSKAWMKQILAVAGVPTAAFGVFDRVGPAIEFLRSLSGPWVVKTDGLAAGKGVLVTGSMREAEADVAAKLSGQAFGDAGRRVVIEQGLTGPELSVMALCDGTRAVALEPAQDYKRVGDGDRGPNTGSMGAYSPVPSAGAAVVEQVMDLAVLPTLAALADRGIDYRGVLYAGLMLTADGPKVLEFNVRFGDPETQVVLPRWEGDVAAVLAAAADGALDRVGPPRFRPDPAVCVVLAAEGYPTRPRFGDRVEGLEAACRLPGVEVYAAGVAAAGDQQTGELITAGGRVLGVTAVAGSLREAREVAYLAVERISWPGMVRRTDIALAAVAGDHTARDDLEVST